MIGRTIVDTFDFLDKSDQRWRQLTLDNGVVLQVVFTHPWLVLSPDSIVDGPTRPQ